MAYAYGPINVTESFEEILALTNEQHEAGKDFIGDDDEQPGDQQRRVSVEFGWDDDNAGHFAFRDIRPQHVEEAFADPNGYAADIGDVNGESRSRMVGAALAGLLLKVIYTRRNEKIRTVTARRANHKYRRLYNRVARPT